MSELTEKQKRFCEEYLIDLNATQSAIRAGYSEKTAYSIGCENLTKPEIQNYISELQEQRAKDSCITQQKVMTELSRVAFGDIKNLFDDMGRLRDMSEIESEVTSGIKSVNVLTEKIMGNGETNYEVTLKKVEQHDKLKALDMISKMLGFYSKDNEQKKPVTNISLKDMVSFNDKSESEI